MYACVEETVALVVGRSGIVNAEAVEIAAAAAVQEVKQYWWPQTALGWME